MQLYNSLTETLERFRPAGEVKLYTCGITPYDTTHLGHAFTYIVSDILVRYLESSGLRVTYVQNVTDIDDDILSKAREVGRYWRSLGNRWTRHFISDMKRLNVRPPDHFPRATDVIPDIVDIVARLLKAGVAYERGGSVYFDIDSWSKYGKLSRLSREEMLPIANERGNNPDDPNKRSPLDFVLWQASSGNEPAWSSPWGAGRPGWHIECSTMGTRLLGDQIDIHSGGEDLLFPHHESEIAQVEPLTGEEPFARFWLHVAMVHHNGEKMSKSLGNLVMIDDLLSSWPADAVRLYLIGNHYRSPWSHRLSELERAAALAVRIEEALMLNRSLGSGKRGRLDPGPLERQFIRALETDLDTPAACEAVAKLAAEILAASRSKREVKDAQRALRASCEILGLRPEAGAPAPGVLKGWDEHLVRFEDS
jgi:L-cysteine:1D-myo-inositol 2-amino-2-deoxy-alpha-D-glucopyranoside ligase